MTAIPKPRPRLLSKREAQADVRAIDRRENLKVKARSKGQCEIRIVYFAAAGGFSKVFWRCPQRAGHVHHLRSGIGIRNRGESITAKAKIHVCEQHHEEIHGHVLKPTNEQDRYDAARVRFTRVR